ncbi:decapping nuclease DXO homolog isoform X1 [Drosophila teissieri]|uniref:decapping nuclease DXO homolog isoform X1 n=2 Tax=Drosophila teissieri TaxID=7243 RepID=UPI001CB9E1E7|nr:decapping nuclease DXO homolog isoform X1 [Drosophila teissieri]
MAEKTGFISVPWQQHRLGGRYTRPFPSMSRPKCLGVCSINASRDYVDDASGASYMAGQPWPELPLDLNDGIEDVIRKPVDHVKRDLEYMLLYIKHHRKELLRQQSSNPGNLFLDTDFVTLRGILRQIMCLQYDTNRTFRIKATLLNGNIYMAKEDTPEQRLENENMSKKQLDMCSWGFKFEQYLTSAQAQGKPITNVPVNEAEEFMGVYRVNLAGIEMLYGAELDCVDSTEPVDFKDPKVLDSLNFVELKTSAFNMNKHQMRSFDSYKSANWWSQSFLVAIQTIYVGLRDAKGMVQKIDEIDVRTLARNKPWNPSAMAWYLEQFLRNLKKLLVTINDPFAVVQVTFRDKRAYYEVLRGPEHQILPDWYRDMLKAAT